MHDQTKILGRVERQTCGEGKLYALNLKAIFSDRRLLPQTDMSLSCYSQILSRQSKVCFWPILVWPYCRHVTKLSPHVDSQFHSSIAACINICLFKEYFTSSRKRSHNFSFRFFPSPVFFLFALTAGAGRYNLSVSVLRLFFFYNPGWISSSLNLLSYSTMQGHNALYRPVMLRGAPSSTRVYLLVHEADRAPRPLFNTPKWTKKKFWQRPRSTMPWKQRGKVRPASNLRHQIAWPTGTSSTAIYRLSQIPIYPAMLSKTVLLGLHFQSFWLTVITDAYCQKTMKLFQTSTHHRFLFPRRGRSQTTTNASWPLGQIV